MVEYAGRANGRALRARAVEHAGIGAIARGIDWILLGAVGVVVAYGLLIVDAVAGEAYFARQALFAAVGGVGLVGAALIDPAIHRRFHRHLYWLTIALMVLVFVAAPLTRGSKRWIDLGFFRFQPSEFGKLLFALALAGIVADRAKRIGETGTTARIVGFAMLPIGLVFLQPDIGTALVYGAALVATLFVAGTRWTHLAALGGIALVCIAAVLWVLPAAGVHVLKPYQEARLTGFTNPDNDPGGLTYNLHQSKTAVGAGGVRGRGEEGATQTKYDYLPEQETDFIFAALAEQRGFVGASLLLGLYLLIVWRGLRIVMVARDLFCAVAAGAVVIALLFQIFVNVGMTMGIAPITGIPLPFVSVGGSSMVSNLVAIGVLLGIHARSRTGGRAARS